VELIDGIVDPSPHYAEAVLALNPQVATEGSALKIAEALAHGRVMVSTVDGARGYEALLTDGLVRVPDVASMAAAIESCLVDPARRHASEAAGRIAIAPWSWTRHAQALVDGVTALVERHR
jgi:glycosyltransferase involved in cell wall biosynthesis